ncbi:MAG: carboxypeptidase-like regulatory domain-containing protein, partial [Planctomycetota bacterium]
YKPFLLQIPPQVQEDTGGDLQGRVFYYFNNEAHPLPFAAVVVEGAEQPAWITDNEGKFGFSGVDPGERTIIVSQLGYYTVSKKVRIGKNSTTFLYIVMTKMIEPPSGGGYGSADVTADQTEPKVVEIRSKHFGPYRHTYYLDGVRTYETVTATIDWSTDANNVNDRQVEWYADGKCFHTCPVSNTKSITYDSHTFDVDNEFAKGQRLEVKAIDAYMGASPNEVADFNVIDPPNGVPAVLLKADTSKKVISYRILGSDNWALNGLLKAVDIVKKGIPGFGGRPIELAARAYATGEIRGDGTASATFLDEHSFYPMEIDGIEVAPSASIILGWDYNDPCDQWDPWGKLGIEVEGSYTSDPDYKIIMVGPVPVPVYWRAALKLVLRELWFTLTGWKYEPVIPDMPKWKASESFIFEILAELMLGVGVADHLAVEGFFGGGPQMHICNKDNFDDLQLRALYLKLYGGIRAVIFIYEYEKTGFTYNFKMLEENPCCDPEGLGLLGATVQVESSGSNGWVVQDRDYQLEPNYAEWIPLLTDPNQCLQQVQLVEDEELLQYNVFGRSQPSIAANNDDLFLAWVWDDPNRDSLHRTVVRFSKYENQSDSWSDPYTIWGDDTADFAPQIATLGSGTALCVWENVSDTANDLNLTEMAAAMDIAAAHYDGNDWYQQQNLTAGNDYLDRSPRLAAADNNAIVVWISNQQNDLGIDPCSDARTENDIRY